MTVKKFFLILKKSLLFFLYVALFFYTITFSTPVSWMVFYFFTVVFLVSFLSTFILWGKAQFEILKGQDNLLNGHLNLKTKSFFPVLIPYLMVSISVKEKTFSTVVPSLFKQKLTVFFSDIRFPRGHHKKIFVRTSGKDVFGFFAHRSKKETPVDLEIYPNLLSSNVLYETLKKMDAKLELKQFSAHEAANFRQIREHQMQDALKDIDWKASFKKQALMVKEYDKETDTALKIYFLGYQSPHFEELLSLTYSLYLELSHFQSVKLYLIGEVNEQLLLQRDAKAFLTIQPTERFNQLKSIWDKQISQSGKKIVVAPIEIISSAQETQAKSIYFLSEESLIHLHIGGK